MNKQLFSSETKNAAGGFAHKTTAREALTQYALTGTLGDTYYATGKEQLGVLKELCPQVSEDYIAKLAFYARKEGFMKDMPAFLVAWLGYRSYPELPTLFRAVIQNGKMIRNVVEVCRSGVLGRKAIPRPLRRLISEWLCTTSDVNLLHAIPGDKPSLADIIKMVHPKTKNRARNSFFSWILGKEGKEKSRPEIIQALEAFRASVKAGECQPELAHSFPFQLVDSLPLTTAHWAALARTGGWHFVRMNLNTFARHGVFEDKKNVIAICDKLRDDEAIRKTGVFPYQIMAAYLNAADGVPQAIKDSLEVAMEVAVSNVPTISGRTVVLVDVSGSMGSAITGSHGRKQESKMRCVDVAALFSVSLCAKNPNTILVPYDTAVKAMVTGRPMSIMRIASQLSRYGGGGTHTSAALQSLIGEGIQADSVIIVSDNEAWMHTRADGLETVWQKFKELNPGAKLVCINLTPEENVQAKNSTDVLNIGGFSDNVWRVVEKFLKGDLTPGLLVDIVEGVLIK